MIFCHQEFGDKESWDLDNPLLISGHFHQPHYYQKNIYYVGSISNGGTCLIDISTNTIKSIDDTFPKYINLCIDYKDIKNFIPTPIDFYNIIISNVSKNFILPKRLENNNRIVVRYIDNKIITNISQDKTSTETLKNMIKNDVENNNNSRLEYFYKKFFNQV